jgi:hypothetical protein
MLTHLYTEVFEQGIKSSFSSRGLSRQITVGRHGYSITPMAFFEDL